VKCLYDERSYYILDSKRVRRDKSVVPRAKQSTVFSGDDGARRASVRAERERDARRAS